MTDNHDTLSLSLFPACLRCGLLRGVVPGGLCVCGCWLVLVGGVSRDGQDRVAANTPASDLGVG
jgi:hypothetical protein